MSGPGETGGPGEASARPPIQTEFARYFAPWGLFLPDVAVAIRADGWLLGRGWSVRWRWNDDGSLDFLASHRMTNERWVVLAPSGVATKRDVPGEGRVTSPDPAEDAASELAYRTAWSEYGRRVEAAGMHPIQGRGDVPKGLPGADRQTWRTDDGPWQSSPLLPTA